MGTWSRKAAAAAALIALLLVPMLPPEHLHRGAVDAHHHTSTLVHRHFAAHTSPNGTHVGNRGGGEGAPVWLTDPDGCLPDSIPLSPGVAVARAEEWPPQSSGRLVSVAPRPAFAAPPHTPFGLRAPPAHL
jgi:hypothetical protein